MDSEVKLLKKRYDLILCKIEYLLPVLNTCWQKPIHENQNHKLFSDSVKKYSSRSAWISLSEGSLQSFVSEAKLHLDSSQLERLYFYAKREFDIRKSHLMNLVSYGDFDRTQEENFNIEKVFFENYNGGHCRLPLFGSSPNPKFIFDLLHGIENCFQDFESEIKKLKKDKVPVKESEGLKSLSQQEAGLYCYYNFGTMTREEAGKIVKDFGLNSGDGLYNKFVHYSSQHNRRELPEPCTDVKFKNKIRRFEKVIQLLPEDRKSKALDELEIIKGYE